MYKKINSTRKIIYVIWKKLKFFLWRNRFKKEKNNYKNEINSRNDENIWKRNKSIYELLNDLEDKIENENNNMEKV